eukprot:11768966-Karenia_brevis.AAC.1
MAVDEGSEKDRVKGEDRNEDEESYSENYKEDEGKEKRRKNRMSELPPAIELTAAENSIREGEGAPSPILPKSVVKSSEAMHQI